MDAKVLISIQHSCLKLLSVSSNFSMVIVNSIQFLPLPSFHSNPQCLLDCMTQKQLPTHSRPHACQILSHRQSLLNSSSQMSPEYCSAFTVLSHPLSPQGCTAQTSRLPRPSALPRLSIPMSQFPLLLIIPSRSDSQSSQFSFSKTEIPAVTKQVCQSNSLYFSVFWSWRKIATSDCSLENHKQDH